MSLKDEIITYLEEDNFYYAIVLLHKELSTDDISQNSSLNSKRKVEKNLEYLRDGLDKLQNYSNPEYDVNSIHIIKYYASIYLSNLNKLFPNINEIDKNNPRYSEITHTVIDLSGIKNEPNCLFLMAGLTLTAGLAYFAMNCL